MSRNIKDYDKTLINFVFVNLLLILIPDFLSGGNNDNYITYFTKFGIQNGMSLLIAFFFSLFINGVIKHDYKYVLVFWKVKNNLPGYRVFTELAKKDHRFDYNDLVDKYNYLPSDPKSQNKEWYKILKKYPDEESILQSHRDFLLFRDLTSIAFSLMIIYLILFLVARLFYNYLNIVYFFIFVFEYLILVVSTRFKAERFVLNVIAHDLKND